MRYLILIIALIIAVPMFGCTQGSFGGGGGTYSVTLPSSDSVNAQFSDNAAPATVVGGPVKSSTAVKK